MSAYIFVFDLGGVLSIKPYSQLVRKWEDHLGLSQREYNLVLAEAGIIRGALTGQFSEEVLMCKHQSLFGISDPLMDQFRRDFWEIYCGSTNEELLGYVQSLKARHRLAILSNAFPGARREEMRRFGYDKLFADIVYSYEVGAAKPDTKIFEILCSRLGAIPSEVVLIDDDMPTVESAATFGIRALHFKSNAQIMSELASLMES
jgi:HAD superfamily hydrolase (TIGR01509 family)